MASFLAIVGFSIMVFFGIAAFRKPATRRKSSMIAVGGLVLWFGAALSRPTSPEAPKAAVAAQESKVEATAAPTNDPTDAPTPKPDHRPERQKIQAYWNHVINSLAIANETTVAASTSVQNDDLVSASQFLKQGREAADTAKEMSLKDVPDGYNDVSTTLFSASDSFANGITKESEFIDTRTPSVGAEALSQRQSAQGSIEDAQHAARLKYVELGGKIGDLESFADAAQAMHNMMKVLSK